jgi:hypothetical protein
MGTYNGHMVVPLRDCLAKHPPVMLEAIAEGWGISLTDEQVPEIVDRLVEEMTHGETVGMVIRRLTDIEREALAFVAHARQVRAHVLGRRYGDVRRFGAGRLEWEQAWHNPASPAERLWFLGLIHRAYGLDEQYHGEVFFVPSEILDVLPSLNALLPLFQVEPTGPLPIVRDDLDALARDAFVILSHMRNHDVRSRKGVLARHELARIRPRLSTDDLPRLQFAHRVCEQAGLIRREEGLWQPTNQAAAWLKQKPLDRRRILFSTWLEDGNWNDLCLMPTVSCEDTGWHNDSILARKSLLSHISRCPTDTWLTVESLIESIHQLDPDFMRPDGDYDSWYIRDADTGQYIMGYRNWDKVEGALIRYFLESPLCWLGMVAVGHAQQGGQAESFRVTQEGKNILESRTAGTARRSAGPEKASPLPRIVVQADFQVQVPSTLSWYDRFLLERFAQWLDEQSGVARYLIDAKSVAAALQRGVTIAQIEAFLRRTTGGRVPTQVTRALRAWHPER